MASDRTPTPADHDDQSHDAASTEPSGSNGSDGSDGSDGGRRRRRPIGPGLLFAITAVALAAAGLVLWIGTRSDDSDAVNVTDALDGLAGSSLVPAGTDPVDVGDAAPDVQLQMLDGSTSTLAHMQGRPVVVNFWSSTCAPCLKEMPDLQKVSTKLTGTVDVLGIDVTDTKDAGADMVASTGVTYPNARDPQAEILAAFGGTALPRTVLLDARGKVVAIHNGALTAQELTDMLRDHDLLG